MKEKKLSTKIVEYQKIERIYCKIDQKKLSHMLQVVDNYI